MGNNINISPKVSVFIPVFNTEKYISQAIESIINQTYKNWELIILDDCSTDSTYEIIKKYSENDTRIKVFRNKKNLGMMPNWIKGITLCSGEYWGKLDADDYWKYTMIEESVNILDKHKDVGLVCTRYDIVNETGGKISSEDIPILFEDNKFSCLDLVKLGPREMFKYNILRQGIGLMRFSIFKDFGTFTLLDSADTEMWFRIGANYNIYCLNKVMHTHRIWSESFMRNNADRNKDRKEKNLYNTRKKIFEYYMVNKLINNKEYSSFKKQNKFIYNSYLIYKNRVKRKYLNMLKFLAQNIFIDTKRALVENIHVDKVFK